MTDLDAAWIPKYLVVKSSTALLSGGTFVKQGFHSGRPLYQRSDGKTLRYEPNKNSWEFLGSNYCHLPGHDGMLPEENAEWSFWQSWQGSHHDEQNRTPVWQTHRVVIQRGKWAVGEIVRVLDKIGGVMTRGEVTKVERDNVTVHLSYFGRDIIAKEDDCEVCPSAPQFVPNEAHIGEMNAILTEVLPNQFSTSLISEIASFSCFGCRSIHGMHIYTGLDAEFYEKMEKKSAVDNVSVSVILVNNTESTVRQLWVDYGGVEREYSPILPHRNGYMNTFKGHPWHLRIGDDLIGCYVLQDVDGDLQIEINREPTEEDTLLEEVSFTVNLELK